MKPKATITVGGGGDDLLLRIEVTPNKKLAISPERLTQILKESFRDIENLHLNMTCRAISGPGWDAAVSALRAACLRQPDPHQK